MQGEVATRLPAVLEAAPRTSEFRRRSLAGTAIELARPAHRTQITKAVLRLREMIFSGEFSSGARMSELPLVALLGVSRTPLRLALAELEHEGLLRSLPAGGYVVREFTQGDVRDAIELRGVLEGTAARFAAERGVPARELAGLVATNQTIRALVHRADYESFERYLHLNEDFHARLMKMARSPLLTRALDGISALPFAGPSAFILAEAELPASRDILIIAHRQHADLIDAIERRQGARAEGLAREHARLALSNLEIVVEHRDVLQRMPGASLISLPDAAPVSTPEPDPA
ncbi:MAG TPA: GntR family transcriptional regulator [Solirubrobacteraceae bacterium]|nr:GntR family transcriptional regulator [Solirubrobacteraceae bacterium]